MTLRPKTDIHISYVSSDSLKPYAKNAKIHTKAQIKKIAASIREFGFLNNIIVDGEGNIIAGHCRLDAAKSIGLTEVPVIEVKHLTPGQIKAYRIADNRLAEDAKWDEQLLAIEIEELSIEVPDLEIGLTGFEMGEIDVILGQAAAAATSDEPDPADILPEDDPELPAVTKLGDLWILGDNRVLCANALEAASYEQLMDGAKAHMVFTDPPYNVPIDGHVSGKGKVRHREFPMATGEMSPPEFTSFLQTPLSLSTSVSRDGAIHYVCMDWRHAPELLEAGKEPYSELKNICVWVKSNGGMGSLYRSRHELVFVYKNGTAPHTNNVQLGKFGRNRTNVWEYPGINSFGKDRDAELAMHPTVKPVAMVKDAILDTSYRGDIILDPFLGSGTTLIAAHQAGRRSYGMELDPLYVDTIIRRWQALTGQQALHSETGELFDDRAISIQGASHEQ